MKRLKIAVVGLILTASGYAQETVSLGQAIDDLTYQWDLESINLNSYDGLSKFCKDTDYRNEMIGMLNQIHHFDSALYKKLVEVSRYNDDKEIDKTLKDIANFEEKYSMKKFIHFLHDECKARAEIEKNAEEAKNDIGMNSYDGQIYIVETELNKYIKHITKRMDNIRKHVHHLHIE